MILTQQDLTVVILAARVIPYFAFAGVGAKGGATCSTNNPIAPGTNIVGAFNFPIGASGSALLHVSGGVPIDAKIAAFHPTVAIAAAAVVNIKRQQMGAAIF